MNMTPSDYSRLQQMLHGSFFYLGHEGPFPDGCGWNFWRLDSGVFRNDWIAAITKLKEIQTAGANNTWKVRYLFVHENVPPLDSLDLDDGEAPDDVLYSSIPKNKREDADWTDIRLTKGLAPFPLFGMNDEPIPLQRAHSVIGGATVRVTFGLRCWRYNPNEPFSFAADVVRVDLLSTPQDNGSPQIGLLLTPPTTPQNSLNRSNVIVGESGNTPLYCSQPLFAFENSNGTPQGDSSLLATVSLNASPQTPTGSASRYNIGNYTSPTRNDMHARASPYQGMIQQHLNGDPKPHRVLGAAFENTDANFSTGNIGNQTGGAVEWYHANPPPIDPHFSSASPGMNRRGHGYRPEYYTYEGGADGNTGNSMYGMHGGALHDKVYDHDKNFTLQDPAGVPVKNTIVTTHALSLVRLTVDDVILVLMKIHWTAPQSTINVVVKPANLNFHVTSALKHGRGANDDNDADKGHRLLKKGKSRAL
ncbi:uncharacterized protein C8R40DRAFT_1074272 [Lentinula edodes]|uniref:uncharacterized protein n=1 Tax=Lentinula edodes TaxID=5353 RepID=UPI001E8E21F2|nr:uncharacterized protein C8R40DRAFT_1074272 [Lentinula edodes]KAH7869211.1 hypothetical protein C8R40DRAFT_1074272 [Lentinula edodes]